MNRVIRVAVFLLPASVALLFAWWTDHRWEDWYITFRASHNLATGNGLVYCPGERVHSFTSPIGTLLPAFIDVATLDASDDCVIWIFRVICSGILGASALVILSMFQKLNARPISIAYMIGMFSTSILIIDFSINGMETAFMMFFLAYLMYTVLTRPTHVRSPLDLAIAGLMYTRPDGFIYGGSILFGLIVFNEEEKTGLTRWQLLTTYLQSCVLAVLIYSPWVLGTSLYYGSPIPHTIVAKGALRNYSVADIYQQFLSFPVRFLRLPPALFTPPYSSEFGGWSIRIHYIGGINVEFTGVASLLTIAAATIWVVPLAKVGGPVRGISLAVLIQHFYLMNISGQGAMPWYIPNVLLPTLVLLSMCLDSLLNQSWANRSTFRLLKLVPGAVLALNCIMLVLGAHQLKIQQEVIENGNRRRIGMWLKEHSENSNDTVFLECLGYIPYFSGLKPYDFPGMSSPEVVEVRKRLKTDEFARIINDLQPVWLVLRPNEVNRIKKILPLLLEDRYELQKVFDVSRNVPDDNFLFGRRYLLCDARFFVFRKKSH